MEKVYKELLKYIETKRAFVLASIVSSKGSVPRKEGATMFLKEDGSFVGTVGGGSAENQACEDAKIFFANKENGEKEYTSSNNADKLGMICGGSIIVKFRYVAENDEAYYEELKKEINELKNSRIKLYIYGAGHVAQSLAPLALKVGFLPIISDDREELLNIEHFPRECELRLIDFSQIKDILDVNDNDFVCIMTKGHKDDYSVLLPAMKSKAYYIGMLGSRKKVSMLYEKLRDEGFTDDRIKDCHSPIGLDISAETPDEVAISILGELIYYRAMLENRLKTNLFVK